MERHEEKLHDIDEPVFAEERRTQILELLRVHHKVRVRELSERFGVSEVTIRNDLKVLEKHGALTRTHGGAVTASKARADLSFGEREAKRLAQKQAIAAYARSLIDPGDTLILDAGTTTLQLAKLLNDAQGLTVAVNDLALAVELQGAPVELLVLGGALRASGGPLTGRITNQVLDSLFADKAFLGTTGLSASRGLTTTDIAEAETRAKMVENARQVIVLADSSKVGNVSFASVASLDRIDMLVTDWELQDADYRTLTETGLKVVRVPAP